MNPWRPTVSFRKISLNGMVLNEIGNGSPFKAEVSSLIAQFGMKDLGCSVVKFEAGKGAFPTPPGS
jgi:hypothetical protein